MDCSLPGSSVHGICQARVLDYVAIAFSMKLVRKTKTMASGPITSWQIDGEKVETVTDFIFLGSDITADSDCSHEIKTLASWKKSYDKLRQGIKKQRHHFANKDPY